jgi:hypothetical protein
MRCRDAADDVRGTANSLQNMPTSGNTRLAGSAPRESISTRSSDPTRVPTRSSPAQNSVAL